MSGAGITTGGIMSAYVKQLQAAVEREHAEQQKIRDEQARAEAQTAREKFVSLEVRLSRLLATIPREVQEEGLSLMALQAQLRARGRGHSRCHVGELGDALRRLHYVRERRWRGATNGFQARWFPAQQR
jgi:hypothetical protein